MRKDVVPRGWGTGSVLLFREDLEITLLHQSAAISRRVVCFGVAGRALGQRLPGRRRGVQTWEDFSTPLPLPPGSVLVLGVVGGWESWRVETKLVGRLAASLRARVLPGVWVETVENHRLELGERLIREAFPDPKQSGLILYGQSMGGSAAVRLARRLQPDGYKFRLVALIDSWGKGDERMPANVARFLNLYQRDSLIRGQRFVLAENPLETRSLGNRAFTYRGKKMELPGENVWRRLWLGSHLRMEYDPAVQQAVEAEILEAIERWPGEWTYPERLPEVAPAPPPGPKS